MDGAKHITDTSAELNYEFSGKQAWFLRRSFYVNKNGAKTNENPGNSRM
jgi:hypothetical protein